MATTPRLLLLLRHAEAVDVVPGLGDIDRPLTDEGREQARRVGDWLAEQGVQIDQVLCSGAVRTRETADLLDLTVDIEHHGEIYNAGSETILEVLAGAEDGAETVLVVGHAPGVPTLAIDLVDPNGSDPEVMSALMRGFPTATLVGIEIAGSWADPAPGRAVLAYRG